jgi:hypothetical protein
MDPLIEYIQAIYNANRGAGSFIINIEKTVNDLNTKIFIPDHRMIVSAIDTVIREPHTCTINALRTHIEVGIIGK